MRMNKLLYFKEYSKLHESQYLGNCTHVGCESNKPITKYFPDATSMSNYVEVEENNTEIDSITFYKYIQQNVIPKKLLKTKNKLEYYYISKSIYTGNIDIKDASVFYIYDTDDDIHYFFKR